jgi:hypothetical protein
MKKLFIPAILIALFLTACIEINVNTTGDEDTIPVTDPIETPADNPDDSTDEIPFTLTSTEEDLFMEMGKVFEGEVILKGYPVYVPSYVVGTETWHLRVVEESRGKLPEYMREIQRYDYRILKSIEGFEWEEPSSELIEQLRQYSEENPATVKAYKIVQPIEGGPLMRLDLVE